MEPRTPYPTDLTDTEWALIAPDGPTANPGGRPEHYPTRDIRNALFSILRSGGAWRLRPHDFPPWPMVYQYGWRWRKDGTWQVRHALRRGAVRGAVGNQRQPSAAVIARQSVKTTETGGSVALRRTNRARGAHGISSAIPYSGFHLDVWCLYL